MTFQKKLMSRVDAADNMAIYLLNHGTPEAEAEAVKFTARSTTLYEALKIYQFTAKGRILTPVEPVDENMICWKQLITEGQVGDYKTSISWTGDGLFVELHNPLTGHRSRHRLPYQGIVEGLIEKVEE